MNRLKLSLFILPFVFVQYSCSNDSTSDLIGDNVNGEVTYNNTVKNIVENNCLFCHTAPPQNGAPMQLTTYADVKNAIMTRGLLDRISRAQGATGMMPNGGQRLPQATINKIYEWAENGFPE